MRLDKTVYNPFVRADESTSKVMTDVIIVLIPCIIMSSLAYGFYPVTVVLVAIASAVLTEYLFNAVFSQNTDAVADGSAIITAILLSFTVGPFTPLYIVAFGAATGVLFGKLLWGGIGRNRFNPALVGREFMTIFFPVVMGSNFIWHNNEILNIQHIDITGNEFIDGLFFRVSGAIGEYSPFFLILGGVYLLMRHRITWHIPFGMLVTFTILLFVFSGYNISFSFGGLFLGAIYMVTDMPTSAYNPMGRLYFGIMTAVVCIICLVGGVSNGYFSYAVLLMNGFVEPINWVFRPKVWGRDKELPTRSWQTLLITIGIIGTSIAVVYLHHLDAIKYLLYFFILYTIIRFILMKTGHNLLESK